MHKILSNILIIICFLMTNKNGFCQENTATDILNKISKKTESYKDITAEFSYIYSKEDKEEVLTGVIYIKEEKYKLEMSDNLYVFNNGNTIWYVMEDLKEIQIVNNDDESSELSPSKIFTIYETGYNHQYIEEIRTKNKTLHHINLTPDNEGSIKNIKIYVDADKLEIETLIIYDLEGGITKYIISEFIADSNIDNKIFNLNIEDYKNMEIIDLR